MFKLTDSPINPNTLKAQIRDPAAGACAIFEGWVRNHNEGKEVAHLEYEAYPAVAEKEGARIVGTAMEKFGVLKALCVHATGDLAIGDMAVWVGVTAAHRGEAFDACRYIIDEIKHRVPIWKKEHYIDGDSGWVRCDHCADHGGHDK